MLTVVAVLVDVWVIEENGVVVADKAEVDEVIIVVVDKDEVVKRVVEVVAGVPSAELVLVVVVRGNAGVDEVVDRSLLFEVVVKVELRVVVV